MKQEVYKEQYLLFVLYLEQESCLKFYETKISA